MYINPLLYNFFQILLRHYKHALLLINDYQGKINLSSNSWQFTLRSDIFKNYFYCLSLYLDRKSKVIQRALFSYLLTANVILSYLPSFNI